jgi:UDP-N-acetylmuramate dehydrogenase
MVQNWIENKQLSTLSTFGIGGPARYFTEVRTIHELQETILEAKRQNTPFWVLGKGSNSLFNDRGFNGLVIANKIDFLENPAPGLFRAGAGYSFSLLGVQTARQAWSGLEFASGIPASVGGAVFMNAGANGKETCETLVSVDYVSEEGIHRQLSRSEIQFGYRNSSFQQMKGVIAAASFQLSPSAEARTRQIEIVNHRKKTQPLAEKSAGCIFRNPDCGHAGALIDQAGLKSVQVGGAKVSEIHANFIINSANAKAEDVTALIKLIKEQVHKKTGIELESEVRVVDYE